MPISFKKIAGLIISSIKKIFRRDENEMTFLLNNKNNFRKSMYVFIAIYLIHLTSMIVYYFLNEEIYLDLKTNTKASDNQKSQLRVLDNSSNYSLSKNFTSISEYIAIINNFKRRNFNIEANQFLKIKNKDNFNLTNENFLNIQNYKFLLKKYKKEINYIQDNPQIKIENNNFLNLKTLGVAVLLYLFKTLCLFFFGFLYFLDFLKFKKSNKINFKKDIDLENFDSKQNLKFNKGIMFKKRNTNNEKNLVNETKFIIKTDIDNTQRDDWQKNYKKFLDSKLRFYFGISFFNTFDIYFQFYFVLRWILKKYFEKELAINVMKYAYFQYFYCTISLLYFSYIDCFHKNILYGNIISFSIFELSEEYINETILYRAFLFLVFTISLFFVSKKNKFMFDLKYLNRKKHKFTRVKTIENDIINELDSGVLIFNQNGTEKVNPKLDEILSIFTSQKKKKKN